MEETSKIGVSIAEHVAPALSNLNLRDKLRSQAIRDPLTGLFNRRYMEETLDREIRRAARHKYSVGVIMIDIDQMKPINDRYGHDAGDVVLRQFGGLMRKTFRGEDVACRYGGDEFMIIMPEASLSDVWQKAENLREMIKRTQFEYDGKLIGPVTVSIGVAAYPELGSTVERLIQVSDAAAYLAKREGGDRVMIARISDENNSK
ncbi:MAG: GGDEF domain-containing protein [Anaerolineales bacterium]|nr:GGDEF domain-containing protein [Anaerolineales bacterium]